MSIDEEPSRFSVSSSASESVASTTPSAGGNSLEESVLIAIIVLLCMLLVTISVVLCLYVRRNNRRKAKEADLRAIPQDVSTFRADGVEQPSSNCSSRQVSLGDDSQMASSKRTMHTRGQSHDFLHPNSAVKFVNKINDEA